MSANIKIGISRRMPLHWALVPAGTVVRHTLPVINRQLNEPHTALCMAHRSRINPKGKRLTGVAGGGAADMLTPLLTTDAVDIMSADNVAVRIEKLREELRIWNRNRGEDEKDFRDALATRYKEGAWRYADFAYYKEALIVYELRAMGIRKREIRISQEDKDSVTVRFPWAYPGNRRKWRRFTFVDADITEPSKYPKALKRRCRPGEVDFYYQKSSMACIASIERYMPGWARAVRGFLMISPTMPSYRSDELDNLIGNMLLPDFTNMDEVNKVYSKYFTRPFRKTRLHPYYWYMQYWRKIG